jgi:hypothetical protein
MMTEGGAFKKKGKPSIQENTNPRKRERTKQRKTKKKPRPKSTQSLKPFFSCILFRKDTSLLQQTNKRHPPQVQCNFPT